MKANTKYMFLHFHDEKNIEKLIPILEKEEQRIVDFFEINQTPVDIHIFEDENEFKETLCKKRPDIFPTKESIPKWVVGQSNEEIDIVSFNLYQKRKPENDFSDYYKMILHEFTHQCIKTFQKEIYQINWLNEGLAIVLSNQNYELGSFHKELKTYQDYYMAVHYLFQTYQKEQLLKLIQNIDDFKKEEQTIIQTIDEYYKENTSHNSL